MLPSKSGDLETWCWKGVSCPADAAGRAAVQGDHSFRGIPTVKTQISHKGRGLSALGQGQERAFKTDCLSACWNYWYLQ